MDAVLDPILDPFAYTFMVRALIVSVLVGVMCPLMGGYVVTRSLAFMGDALAHSILPALVIGFLLEINPFGMAVPGGIIVALLIGFLSRRAGFSEDTSIGILFAGLFALGLILLATSEGIAVNLESLLVGQVLAVSWQDVYITLGLAALALLILFAFQKELTFASFDPTGASVMGLPTSWLDYLLLGLLAVVIVIALQAVGIVLVMAMLVTPAATAYLLVSRFTSVMVLGALLGAGAAIAGLYLSFHLNLPSGAAMTLVATGTFVLVSLIRRRII